MNRAEIYGLTPPGGTIMVVPRKLDYIYDRDTTGGDVIGILLDDAKVGALFVALTPIAAQHITAHLSAMLDDLVGLRSEWEDRNK